MTDENFATGSTHPESPARKDSRPEAVRQPTPWGAREIVAGIFATFFCGIAAAILFQAIATDTERMTLPRILAGIAPAWVGYGLLAYLVARRYPGGVREQLGLRFDLRHDIYKGIFFGLVGQLLASLVYVPINLIWPGTTDSLSGPADNLTETLSSWRWAVFCFFVGVVSPLGEELFFRGLTMRALWSRYGRGVAIAGSALIFGAIHLEPLQTLALAAFGALLAWRATKTSRIGETVIAHSTFNLLTVAALIWHH